MEAPVSDLDWMALRLDALFASDARGRLLHPRRPGGEAQGAPRLVLGRTRHGQLWRFAAGVPRARVAEVARLLALERLGHPLRALPERFEPIRACLAQDLPVEITFQGRCFRFPPAAAAGADAGVVWLPAECAGAGGGSGPPGVDLAPFVGTSIGRSGLPVLQGAMAARRPCAVALDGDLAASICFTAARSSRAAEAGVVTAPERRGRGFAARAVAAWAREVAAAGLHPLYSAECSSRASLALAARLGLIPFGVDLQLS